MSFIVEVENKFKIVKRDSKVWQSSDNSEFTVHYQEIGSECKPFQIPTSEDYLLITLGPIQNGQDNEQPYWFELHSKTKSEFLPGKGKLKFINSNDKLEFIPVAGTLRIIKGKDKLEFIHSKGKDVFSTPLEGSQQPVSQNQKVTVEKGSHDWELKITAPPGYYETEGESEASVIMKSNGDDNVRVGDNG
jgi:hypothetical protein